MEKIGNIWKCPKCKEEYESRPFFWTNRLATKKEVKDKGSKCIRCTSPPAWGFRGAEGKIEYKSVHSYDKKLDYYLCKGHKKRLKKEIKAFNERPPIIKRRKNEEI